MLKYIGDFNKLKDYGFEYNYYEREDLKNSYSYENKTQDCCISIIEDTRKGYIYWASPCNSGEIQIEFIETITQLIKDGLVIKESE